MDRNILERNLAQAEKYVSLGERYLAQQRELIEKVERAGHPANGMKELMAGSLQSQTRLIDERDQLRKVLFGLKREEG